MHPNHRIVEETGLLFNKTKLTLLMLRKVRSACTGLDRWMDAPPMLGRLTPPGTGSSHAPHSQDGEIELRHQRNPDCVFDFVKPRAEGELTCEKPAFIYEVIETLLPQAVFSKDNASGDGLLELCVERASGL